MAKDIKQLREDIGQIDKEMASLFEARMNKAAEIADYKKQNDLPVYDPKREAELLKANENYISNPDIKPYYRDFLQTQFRLSKAYQTSLLGTPKVAYSGVPGAFAYVAAKKAFPEGELIPCPNFSAAYQSVVDGDSTYCVLPIENSFAGDVGNVMDLIFNGPLVAVGQLEIPVSQNLMAVKGTSLSDVKLVYSHPQALEQCQRFIEDRRLGKKEAVNTAIAAKEVAEKGDKTIAAIASKETAELYWLDIIAPDINEAKNNTTRFLVFAKSQNKIDPSEKGVSSLLLFTVKNESGSLAGALNIIGAHSYNMRNLKSRPMKELMWSYYFFVELEGNIDSPEGEMMLTELKVICDRVKSAGVYKEINQ